MGQLFDELVAFFRKMGWPVNQVPDHPILSFTYEGGTGTWVFVASVAEETRIVTMFSRAPVACPPERMPAMCEFIVRANYGMTHGNFDMDHADGEIRYRTGVDLAGYAMNHDNLVAMARYNLASMDVYLPAIQAVIQGTHTPEAAVVAAVGG